jgi:nitrite reductase (NADH) large subunit
LLPYVIIGMGAAGVSAAEAIRSVDQTTDIFLVGEESAGYYSRPGLAFYLSGEIPQSQLFPMTEADFRRIKVKCVHACATRIEAGEHRVQFDNGKSLRYRKILIATGASASSNRLPGAQLEGVTKLDCIHDAEQLLKLARKARAAVVVGGGITALELVEGLVARGVKTHYLLRGDRYWSNVLDEEESRIVEDRLVEDGVTIHYSTEIEEILGRNGRVIGVRTKDEREIPCEIVSVAIGVTPRKNLAEVSGIKVDKGILVNENMETDQTDIYAAGDAAQILNPVSGKSIIETLWIPARNQGFAAGLNMAGRKTAYHQGLAFNVTRLANLTTTIIGKVGDGKDLDLAGIARGESEIWREMPEAIATQSNFDVNHLRLLVGKDTLVGAVLIGSQTLSQALQVLVGRKVDISPIRERLLEPGAGLADIIAEFWVTWNACEGEYVRQ